MENAIVKSRKDGCQNEVSLQCLSKGMKSAEDDTVSNRLVGKLKPEHVFILDSRIPKQIINFDEQYLRCCLELVQIRALKAASCNIPSDMSHWGAFSDNLSTRKISSGNTYYLNEIVNEFPSVAGTENVMICSARDSILGAITESKSMMNILKSPLLRQLGASDGSVNFGRTSLVDVEEHTHFNFVNSPSGLDTSSPQKVHRETLLLREHIYRSEHVHNRLSSLSSTNSSCSDQSSSAPATVSRGMLHCTWNNGFPHYVFSVDDQREIFIANLLKVESPDNKVMDYMYTFHSRAGGRKDDEIHENESDFIGKMRVSTSFTLLPDNKEIMETQFVLFGSSDDFVVEMPTSIHTLKKNKGFTNKVVDVFKASHTYKHRSSSKLRVLNAILETSSCDPCQDSPNNLDPASRIVLSENHLPPNLELAAIIVKDHIRDNNNEVNIGGWGLKFLKKVGNRRTNTSVETQVPSQRCVRNNGHWSTSMDILIPAGFHGGPRTRNGGPSSLIERWRSGGCCDCGGWDIGCPLTILNARPSRTEVLSQTDISCEPKTFDIFVEGLKQDVPAMRMVNIHDGLYYIPLQSPLSAMQSFSIAVAIIHTHSPNLQPKLYKVK